MVRIAGGRVRPSGIYDCGLFSALHFGPRRVRTRSIFGSCTFRVNNFAQRPPEDKSLDYHALPRLPAASFFVRVGIEHMVGNMRHHIRRSR